MTYPSDLLNPISQVDATAFNDGAGAGDGKEEDGTDYIEWSGSLPAH